VVVYLSSTLSGDTLTERRILHQKVRVEGRGSRVQGSGSMIEGCGLRVEGRRLRVEG